MNDTVSNPLKALMVWARGPKVDGEMAPEISLDNQRSAEYVFEKQVQTYMESAPAQERKKKSGSAA